MSPKTLFYLFKAPIFGRLQSLQPPKSEDGYKSPDYNAERLACTISFCLSESV